MKFLAKILKKKSLFIVIGFLLLIGLILIVGSQYRWPMDRQILGIVLILFLGIMIFMYRRLQAAKSAASIEASIKKQHVQTSTSRPGQEEEIEQLKHQLTEAIESLKSSKLSKGVTGKSALYALPWYMFIGPPGAGKTTAIENSGLEFPHGTNKIRGVGGTRNCDWFFTNSAILLDTAGRYTTEEDDRDEWFAFLDMLKKNRRRRPVNGVIIGYSITDIIQSDSDELEEAAKTVRNRIDELIDRLGVQFPVYLVFTKCDLIQGFVEFFENFGKNERDQIWGCTFSREQQSNPDTSAVLNEEFQQLHSALVSKRLDRLNNPMNRKTRQRVYTFPLEFGTLQEQLDMFTTKLFQRNPYRENPIFRGFYFTSGTQEGVPIDRVVQEIVSQFHLTPEQQEAFNPEIETKSFFIKDLFTDTIIPDQHMVNKTARASRQHGLLKIGAFGTALLLVALIFVWSTSNYVRFRSDSYHFLDVAEEVESIRWEDESFSENFYALDEYKNRLQKLDRVSILRGSIYRGKQIIEPAQTVYYTKLRPFVEQYIYKGILQEELRSYVRTPKEEQRDDAYDKLRVYLLLGTELERLRESRIEQDFLQASMISLADSLLDKKFNFAYQSTQNDSLQNSSLENLKTVVKEQVGYFAQVFPDIIPTDRDKLAQSAFSIDSSLVINTRKRLGAPNISDVYARVKRESVVQTTPLTLADIIGGDAAQYFTQDPAVPGFFTREGWNAYAYEKLREASQAPDESDWVLALETTDLPEEFRDPQIMQRELLSLYFDEYVIAWERFLSELQYRSFNDFRIASRALRELGDQSNSPIQNILDAVVTHTQFENILDRSARGLGERVGIEGERHVVDRAFQSIHNLADSDENNLSAVLGQFELVGTVVDGLQKENAVESANYAANVLQQRSGEFPDALREIQNTTRGVSPKVQEALFVQPVILAWRLILGRAESYLNDLWENQVYGRFQQALAPHYPFNSASQTEAPIADIVSFFQNGNGILWTFIDTELGPFIKDNAYNSNSWAGYGLQLSTRTKQALQKARVITNGLGLQSQGDISIRFSILPALPTPSGIVDQITFSVDGNSFSYRLGRPQWREFSWPGYGNVVGTHLEISSQQGNYEPKTFNSQWGLFRLLDQSEIEQTSPSHYSIRWVFSGRASIPVVVTYRLRAESINNPFGDKNFFNLQLPGRLF